MQKKYKGFTLIELLIVMVIIAVLISFTLYALINFGESSKLNRAVTDFVSKANTDMSNARNNVYKNSEIQEVIKFDSQAACSQIGTNPDFVPSAIGYSFQNSDYVPIKCLATKFSSTINYCCVQAKDTDTFLDYVDENITIGADCKSIIFEYSTGDILTSNSNQFGSMLATDDNCKVTLTNNRIGFSKDVLFKGTDNAIEIQQ